MSGSRYAPPQAIIRILRRLLPGELGANALADLEQGYVDVRAARGRLVAWAWYAGHLLLPSTWTLSRELRRRARGEVGGSAPWDAVLLDLRFAMRTLARSPGFALVTVLTVGVGIGGATALFSVVEGVLLRPLPYPESEQIVQLWQLDQEANRSRFSHDNLLDVAERSRGLEHVAGFGSWSTSVSVRGRASRVTVTEISRDLFAVIGIQPELGRFFTPEELATGAPVAVVDRDFWLTELGGRPDLGVEPLRSGDASYTVIGVVPSGLAFPWGTGAWIPRDPTRVEYRSAHNWTAVARLAADTELETARAELSGIAAEVQAVHGSDTGPGRTSMVDILPVRLHEQLVGFVRPALLVLLGAAGFLLLVACANVVNLLLARAQTRRAEVAIRQAMGAGRGRIASRFLTEAVVLSLAGGVVGVILARFGLEVLLALEPGQLPRTETVGLNAAALSFALAVSCLVAAGLGLLTSARVADDDVRDVLAEAGRSAAGGARTERTRRFLTTMQVAMTLVLLVGASLVGRSFLRLSSVDPGYRTSGAVVIDTYLPDFDGPDAERDLALLRDRILERLRGVSGVGRVGIANAFPLGDGGADGSFLIMERPDEVSTFEEFVALGRDPSRTGYAEYRVASAGYFQAMGIPLLRGRLFDGRDDDRAVAAAVISESLAQRRWPDEDPIGKFIQYGNMDGDVRPYEIVGIVADVRERALDAEPQPTFYGNALQRPASLRGGFTLVLQSGDAARVAPAAQAAIREVAPEVPVRVRSLEQVFSASLAQRRFGLVLLGTFALAAVALAITGIYGVISYLVAQRSREWAIRLALGATRADVLRQVLAGGVWLVLTGVVVGTAIALAAGRFLERLLYDIEATDVPTFVGVALLLVTVSLAASYVPAARATRVDPVAAMRE